MTPPSNGPPDDRKAPDPTTTVKDLQIRLDFAYDEKSPTPDVQGTLLKIFKAWQHANHRLTISNDEGKPISVDDWPEDVDKFQNLVHPKPIEKRQRHIVTILQNTSDSSLSQLRNQAWTVLTAKKVHIFQHYHASSQFDVTVIGWYTKTKPNTFSHIQFKNELQQFLRTTMAQPTFDAKNKIKESFPKETSEHRFFLPKFEILPGSPAVNVPNTETKVQTKALIVEVDSQHVRYMKAILEESSNINHPAKSRFDHFFVPYSAKFELQPVLYAQLLREQNKFLDTTRNIPLAGISQEQMKNSTITVEGVEFTPERFIMSQPEIVRLDSHSLTPELGRWNITVTKKGYTTMVEWIDDQLSFLFPTSNPRFSNTDFPNATRMNKRKGFGARSKPQESGIQYLQTMLSTTENTNPEGTHNFDRPSAWNVHRRPPTYEVQTQAKPESTPTVNMDIPSFPV